LELWLYEILVELFDGAVLAGIFFTWQYATPMMLEDLEEKTDKVTRAENRKVGYPAPLQE
jgi:hypothetical protein